MRKDLIPKEESILRTTGRVRVPESVTVSFGDNVVSAEGPLGSLKRCFKGDFHIRLVGNEIVLSTDSLRKHDRAMIGTTRSHLQNMIIGVTEGFTYRLFIYFKHFPMTVEVKDRKVYIDNFLGEKSPRWAKKEGDVQVEVISDQIIVRGIDKEAVAQTAANIHLAARVRNRSLHGRGGGPGFLDGIYVFERDVGEGKGNLPADKLQFARRFYFEMKICRSCGSRNAPTAIKCRRCRSKNLRKRKAVG